MSWKEHSIMELRKAFVMESVESGINFSNLCREYGISRKTGYKWLKRYEEFGFKGLEDLSKRPLNCPNEINSDVCLEIIRLKNQYMDWGPKKIHSLYERRFGPESTPSRITVERILDKAGFVTHVKRQRKRNPIRKKEIIKPVEPNDVWTVDFKGWWPTSRGFRCEPLTIRDEYSKFILCLKSMASTKGDAVKGEFRTLFERYGLPKVIRSDNGQPFACTKAVRRLTRLSVWFITLGIQPDPTNPGCPQDNGGHERMHKDIRDQLEIKGIADQDAFDIWRHEFNWIRPHETLDMKTPSDVYRNSDRVFPDAEIEIVYPASFMDRIVTPKGNIKYKYKYYFISTSLAGMKVGLKCVENDRLEVWFDNLFLGIIDPEIHMFTCYDGLKGNEK